MRSRRIPRGIGVWWSGRVRTLEVLCFIAGKLSPAHSPVNGIAGGGIEALEKCKNPVKYGKRAWFCPFTK
jgi:hypothetical protein